MHSQRFFRCGAIAIALGLIVGCNSGDGTGSADIIGTISAQNAEAIAQDGSASMDFLMQQSGIAEGFADEIANPGTIQSACQTGAAQVQVNDAGTIGQADSGDYVYVTFTGCTVDLGGGLTLQFDGTIWVTCTQATGTQPSPYTREFRVDYFGLTMSIGGASLVISGTYWVSEANDGTSQTNRIYGNRIIVTAVGGQATWSGSMSDFDITRIEDNITTAYTTDMQATYTSSAAAGSVTIMTTTPFAGPDNQSEPSSGVMTISGANGGVITFTALDSVNVQLDVDVDGDGTPEATIQTTWAVIRS